MAELNGKQMRFVLEYLVDGNATQAAIRAGYSKKTAHSQGPRLLENVEVAAEIERRQTELGKRLDITAERVLREYARLAFMDVRELFDKDGTPKGVAELDDDAAAAIVGLDVLEVYKGTGESRKQSGYIKKYKLADKKGALDSLARHLGLFNDKVNVSGDIFVMLSEQAEKYAK